MTKEELAARMCGRSMGKEITREECAEAKAAGLVVVFGYGDDYVEFRGAMFDEDYVDGNPIILIGRGRTAAMREGGQHHCDCDFCGFHEWKRNTKRITAHYGVEDQPDWEFTTDIPHAEFDIYKDGRVFCRGIVFDIKDTQ